MSMQRPMQPPPVPPSFVLRLPWSPSFVLLPSSHLALESTQAPASPQPALVKAAFGTSPTARQLPSNPGP